MKGVEITLHFVDGNSQEIWANNPNEYKERELAETLEKLIEEKRTKIYSSINKETLLIIDYSKVVMININFNSIVNNAPYDIVL